VDMDALLDKRGILVLRWKQNKHAINLQCSYILLIFNYTWICRVYLYHSTAITV